MRENNMAYEIVMPQLGLTMTEGSVTTWLKKPGEWVEKGEILFTVQTDKVEMEVESFGSGYLNRISVEPGQAVPVGTMIAALTEQPEEKTQAAAAAPVPVVESKPAPPPPPHVDGVQEDRATQASPRARKLARELGIDIRTVKPLHGSRIVEDDVRRAHDLLAKTEERQAPTPVRSVSSPVRKAIARKMTASFQSAPHFYLSVEVDASELLKVRGSLIETVERRAGARLSYTDLFLRAMAIAIREQPEVNQSWWDGDIISRPSIDLAFAVQTAEMLVAPVIRSADQMSLFDLARQRHTLTEKARTNNLTAGELEGGSATLSNLGPLGVDYFQAILNPPESVILAAGRIAKRPVVVDDAVVARPTVILTLSVDHRVLDGACAARFLQRIKALAENPCLLLV